MFQIQTKKSSICSSRSRPWLPLPAGQLHGPLLLRQAAGVRAGGQARVWENLWGALDDLLVWKGQEDCEPRLCQGWVRPRRGARDGQQVPGGVQEEVLHLPLHGWGDDGSSFQLKAVKQLLHKPPQTSFSNQNLKNYIQIVIF